MFPKRFYKIFGIRVKLGVLGGGTMFLWDDENEHLIPSKPINMFLNVLGLFLGGYSFVSIHLLQMYLKTHNSEIDEEGASENNSSDSTDFATLIIEMGEVLASSTITCIMLVFLDRHNTFQFLVNQLLDYNKKLSEMIESGKLVLTDDHKQTVRSAELFIYYVMVISSFVPFCVAFSTLAEVEPTNQLIYDWLEVKFRLTWYWSPFLVILIVATISIGSTIGILGNAIVLYYLTFTVCTDAFFPEAYTIAPGVGRGRCKLKTKCFGTISDDEVIRLYRVQQLLNVQINYFFASVKIAFHHVGALSVLVALLVFVIRYNKVVSELGIIGYTVVLSSMSVPLLIIYTQTKMAGQVVSISDDFRFSAEQLMPRRFLFRKFTKSCTSFYIQVAYPFYTVDKDTFVSFCEQAQDYTINLLLY